MFGLVIVVSVADGIECGELVITCFRPPTYALPAGSTHHDIPRQRSALHCEASKPALHDSIRRRNSLAVRCVLRRGMHHLVRLVVVPLASHTRERERAGAAELDGSHGLGADADTRAVHNARHLVELGGTRGVRTRRLEDFRLRPTPLRLQERARSRGHEQRNKEDRPRSHGRSCVGAAVGGSRESVHASLQFEQGGSGYHCDCCCSR